MQDVYETFNIMMRRKPKENNFKAVLETIRDLMNTECVVPDWLHDLILGYGSPDSAHYLQYVHSSFDIYSLTVHSQYSRHLSTLYMVNRNVARL